MKRMVDESLINQNSILKYGKEILGYQDPVYIKFYSPVGSIEITAEEKMDNNITTFTSSNLNSAILLFENSNVGIDEVITRIIDENPDYSFVINSYFLETISQGLLQIKEGGQRIYYNTSIFNKGWLNYPAKIYSRQPFSEGFLGNRIENNNISIENLRSNYIESNIEGVVKRYSVKEFIDYVNQII